MLYTSDTQRAVNSPMLYNNYGNSPISTLGYNANFATNDPSALCLSGNAYTMKLKGNQFAQGLPKQVKSLRISITGTNVQAFNLCCWISTILFGSIFLFPLFFICCDWWKKKTFQTFTVDPEGYQGIAQLIRSSEANQIYLTVQDSYFNAAKAHILIEAISQSRVQNFSFINSTQGFNVDGDNYSNFQLYMRPILQFVKFSSISWGRKFVR